MRAYLLGLVTLPVIALTCSIAFSVWDWFAWWFNPRLQESYRGVGHVADYHHAESDTWYPRGVHQHRWPHTTPWWLCRALDPIRRWWCLRQPDHRPATPKDVES